jgi:hypothetical protein
MEDPVLGLDVWKVRHREEISGLPAIDNFALYFVSVSSTGNGQWRGLDVDNGELVVSCRRNVGLL